MVYWGKTDKRNDSREQKRKGKSIIDILKQRYDDAACALHYAKDYELMISVRLSAQCTDARVNIVTEKLFKQFPTLQSFADASEEEIARPSRPAAYSAPKRATSRRAP